MSVFAGQSLCLPIGLDIPKDKFLKTSEEKKPEPEIMKE